MKNKLAFTARLWAFAIFFLTNILLLNAQVPFLNGFNTDHIVHFDTISTEYKNAKTSRLAYSNPARVRVAYVVPSNRTAQANYKENLQFAIEMAQMWFRNNMNQNGFGLKTFIYETEDNSPRPKIHLVNATETDSYLRGSNAYELFDRTKVAAKNAGLTVDSAGEVWVLIPETHIQNPTGSFSGGLALGAGGGSGDNSGVTQLSSTIIQLFNPQKLIDNTQYAGKIVPEWGSYPLVQDSSFVWFEGTTFSSVASSYLGALCHEMGHAFGLNHDTRHDSSFFGGLMYNGLRGIRGSFFPSLYPTDYTRLEYGSSIQLSQSHYFNQTKIVNSAPNLSILTTGVVTPLNGLVNINFNATDSDSIYYAQLFNQYGDVVDEMVFSPSTSIMGNFKTPYYTAGQDNIFFIGVCDKQGNRQVSSAFTLTITAGSNQAPKPFLKILYPNAPYSGNYTRFDASSTSDPNGDPFTTEFDFNNDGIFDTPPLSSSIYNYSIPQTGPYLSRIRVTDSHGASFISNPISGNYGKNCGVDPPTISGINKICPGTPTKLTANGCYGTLLWSNGETDSSIIVNPTSTTVYTVTCSYGCDQTSQPFTLEVISADVALSNIATSGMQRGTQTITSTQQIPKNSNVLYTAGNSITLLPDFQTENGSVFMAFLKGCNNPIAKADDVVATVGYSNKIDVASNDLNPDGTAITNFTQVAYPTIITNPTKGTAMVNADGTINYVTNGNVSGTDSFVYSICNKNDPTSCATANVTINLQAFTNPILNPNFNTKILFDTPPWQKGGWKLNQGSFNWTGVISRSFPFSILIYSGPSYGDVQSNDLYVYQAVTLAPNTNYILKGWVKTENVTTNTNPNGIGACLSLIISDNPWPPKSPDLKGTNDWTQLSLPFNSGTTGVVKIACRLGYTNADSEGRAYFDDLTIEPSY